MKTYYSKPVEVQAVQWKINNFDEVWDFISTPNLPKGIAEYTQLICSSAKVFPLKIKGEVKLANKHDFIVKFEDGTFDVIEKETFLEKYESH